MKQTLILFLFCSLATSKTYKRAAATFKSFDETNVYFEFKGKSYEKPRSQFKKDLVNNFKFGAKYLIYIPDPNSKIIEKNSQEWELFLKKIKSS